MSVRFWPLYDKIYCEKTLLNRKNNILAGYWYCELICRNGAPMIHLDGETSSLLELKRSSCLTQGQHILRRVWFAPLNNLAKGKNVSLVKRESVNVWWNEQTNLVVIAKKFKVIKYILMSYLPNFLRSYQSVFQNKKNLKYSFCITMD